MSTVHNGKRKAKIASLVVTASLVAGACGSSGAAGTSSGSKTLKIGILTDFDGPLGSFGKPDQQGFQLAAQLAEKSGALPPGWKISFVVADDKSDVATSVSDVTQMMSSEGVSFVVGPSSGPIVAEVPLAARYNVPIISQYAGATALNKTGGKWVYRGSSAVFVGRWDRTCVRLRVRRCGRGGAGSSRPWSAWPWR